MNSLPLLRPPTFSPYSLQSKVSVLNPRFRISCSSARSDSVEAAEYKPGVVDDLFLNLFRSRMVKEVGWDSEKPGYEGLIDVANQLMKKSKSNSKVTEAAVRILISLFPPFLLDLYRMLVAPIGGGKVAAMMVGESIFFSLDVRVGFTLLLIFLNVPYFEARVTALSCQWLMGQCSVNSVNLPDGSSCSSGVFVERCKYLEESKCVGICINTCKLPTQTFFKDYMGVPLLMEPDFTNYSCQFSFGVLPPRPEEDSALMEPCLEICPNATRRKEINRNLDNKELVQCPKA